MTKEESKMMQGVAILIMIFYHLFNVEEYHNTVIGHLAKANNPVPFYVFLSGYGLYCVYLKGRDHNRFKRCIKLYFHYWLITGSFIVFSLFLGLRNYDFSLSCVVANITGWETGYYASAWFVLPYCLLSVASPFLMRFVDNQRVLLSLILSYLIYALFAYLNRFGNYNANVWQVFYIQFSFILGAVFAKCNIFSVKEKIEKYPPPYPMLLLIVLMVLRYFLPFGMLASLYAALFILIFVMISLPKWMKYCLVSFGKESLNMWMIHTWIFLYLFREEIYGLDNPAIIYLAVVLVSYVLSRIFNIMIHPLSKVILR